MAGKRFPLVLVPRFSTYVGRGKFRSIGMEVSPFEKAVVHLWRSVLLGVGPDIKVVFEESTDKYNWTACQGGALFTPGQETETTKEITLKKRFFRVVVELFGTGVAVTLYAVGHLTMRETVAEEPASQEVEVSPHADFAVGAFGSSVEGERPLPQT